ncbi:MAG: pyridoxal phosphate-dependent aminotransferase [Acidobacteriota bacterium]
MRLASRVGRIAESATARITRKASELAARGVEVINLGVGEPDFASPPVAVEAAGRGLAEGFTRYTPTDGLPALREALAKRFDERHGAPWTARDGVITCGAKVALLQLALACFEDGDEVVLASPCWVSFPQQIRFAGARPVPVATASSEAFEIRAEPLLAAVTERTRAILINSPSNPTGGLIAAEELERLTEGCAERGLLLIADETYDRFVFGGRNHASAAALAGRFPDTVVLVGSFSKTWAMTGWRVGYLFGPPAVAGAISRIQSHGTGNPTSFAMLGALAALGEADEEIARRRDEFERRRNALLPRLNALPGFHCEAPMGAFYAFPRVDDLFQEDRKGSADLADFFLDRAGVALVPGIAFGDDRHLRLSYACSDERLERGLEQMAAALARLD